MWNRFDNSQHARLFAAFFLHRLFVLQLCCIFCCVTFYVSRCQCHFIWLQSVPIYNHSLYLVFLKLFYHDNVLASVCVCTAECVVFFRYRNHDWLLVLRNINSLLAYVYRFLFACPYTNSRIYCYRRFTYIYIIATTVLMCHV